MASTHALMQAGLNLIQQAISIYDSDLRLAACNARFAELFDLPAALTRPGARFRDTVRHLAERGEYGPVDDLESFVDTRVEQARAFEPHYMERPRANGRFISVEGAPLPQGGWVTVYTDITAVKAQESLLRTRSELLSEEVLKRSEQLSQTNRELAATITALEEARRELTEMEARTRTTTEMMPAHIARLDAAGRYTFSNKRLSAVLPGRPSDILGMTMEEALGPQAFARVEPHLRAAYEGRQSIFEFTDALSSRRIRGAFTPDPLERGVYILSQDVTEETQARAALQQTRRRELAAQLTSGLAHDFSNLLTIIMGMQSKLARLDLPPEADPLVAATMQAARRGGTLLSRIAGVTSHRAWRPEPVVPAELLDELATLARPSLPGTITLDVTCTLEGALMLDAGMLQDSLLNLVLNARDACGAQGDTDGHGENSAGGRITIEAGERQGIWFEIIVSDTGPGFTDEALARGRDPFFTTKGGEGSGLGLAMVYDMTKLAGGDLRLANTDAGAQVTLRLPLRRAETVARAGLVLLVEDAPELRESVREMLTGMGFSVVEAASVAEAILLAEGLPDIALVLSDIALEGDRPGAALPDLLPGHDVRLMTSLPPGDSLRRRAQARAPVIAKPFTAADLARFLGVPASGAEDA
ncbi:PAS-domain containing protein [Citreimonas salinaria]|uniref:histidine kinase n=1 Tax=Citreimonas salinaria TaxID=321339 RepID=A0A1H3MAY3_9RHOB|nr:PAS-domain containing protein [Citreimonas salinaria]SDY73474.1 Signal transduction histidine kinase [Citreimonas salinaria]